MKNQTKIITMTAMMGALAYLSVALFRIPVVLFLEYEPKDVIITLSGLILGPMVSCILSVMVSAIEMMTISGTGIIGCIMNILSTCAFSCSAAVIYKKKHNLSGVITGLIAGSFLMVSIMLLWNYLITPLYLGCSREAVVELLIPAILPFNLIKSGLNSAFVFLLYKPLVTALRKNEIIDATESSDKKKPIGLSLLAVFMVITCGLYILSMQGIL